MEDVACKLSESLGGSVTALSMLKGVLEARKILMGEEHFRTFKTMGNLGYWYRQYGWKDEGMRLLQKTVDGLKGVLGDRNEDTLYAMYKLADAESADQGYNKEVWLLFERVLEGQVEVLGKNHPATLETMERLEAIHGYCFQSIHHFDEKSEISESFVKCQIQVRGDDHELAVKAMDLLAQYESQKRSPEGTFIGAHKCLASMVNRRIPVLAEEGGNLLQDQYTYVLGSIRPRSPYGSFEYV
ncbi:hypothetical protein RUND412_002968 [Rhizina undulata]